MSIDRLNAVLKTAVDELKARGTAKGKEMVVTGIKPATETAGPRYFIEGYGDREFIRMNSNSYLGMSMRPEVIEAEEAAVREFGTGPGAVRFISGTYKAHTDLEKKLARFHEKEAAMLFSSAYVTSLGVLMPLASEKTVYVSDELNHNCIIQAMRLSRPQGKAIYRHNDMEDLEAKLKEWSGKAKRALVVTDGVFSMRGDNAPLDQVRIGHYWATDGISGWPHDNSGANVYVDDVYFDTTWARVEVGDAATYAASTHREIQIVTAWSDTAVSFTPRRGTLPAGPAWAYVIGSDGNVLATQAVTLSP